MKRMRNSVKAIIISICAVVVAVSTIVGIVLLNKKDPTPPPTTPPGSVGYQLTDAQKDLVASINAESKKQAEEESKVMQEVDSSKLVDETGSQIAIEKVEGIYDNYFVVKEGSDSYVYLFDEDEQGNKSTINLFDYMKQEELIEDNSTFESYPYVFKDFVVLNYSIADALNQIEKFVFIDLHDIENLKILNTRQMSVTFEYDSNNQLQKKYFVNDDEKVNRYEYFVFDNFYLELITKKSDNKSVYEIYTESYNEEKDYNLNIDVESLYESDMQDNSITLVLNNSKAYYIYFNGTLRFYEYLGNSEVLYEHYVSRAGVLIEKAVSVKTLADRKATSVLTDANRYYDYYYEFYSFVNHNIKSLDLSTGYSKMSFLVTDKNSDICFYEQKVDDAYALLDTEYVIKYLDKNLNLVLKYNSSFKNGILYSLGDRILTSDGIISSKNNSNGEYLFKFKNDSHDYELRTKNFTNNSFIVYDNNNSNYALMNIYGEFIFTRMFSDIFDYQNGYYVAYSEMSENETTIREYFLINVNDKTCIKIDNFYFDSNDYNEDLIFSGFGYYFVNVNENLHMYNYKKEEVKFDEKIESFIYNSKLKLLNVNLVNSKVSFYSLSNVNKTISKDSNINVQEDLEQMPSEQNSSPELYETHYDPYTMDSDRVVMERTTYNGYKAIKVTVKSGRYIKSIHINFAYDGIGYNGYLDVTGKMENGSLNLSGEGDGRAGEFDYDYDLTSASDIYLSSSAYVEYDSSSNTGYLYFYLYNKRGITFRKFSSNSSVTADNLYYHVHETYVWASSGYYQFEEVFDEDLTKTAYYSTYQRKDGDNNYKYTLSTTSQIYYKRDSALYGSEFVGLTDLMGTRSDYASSYYYVNSSYSTYGDLYKSVKFSADDEVYESYTMYFTGQFDNTKYIYKSSYLCSTLYVVTLYQQNYYEVFYEIPKPNNNVDDKSVKDNTKWAGEDGAEGTSDDDRKTFKYMQAVTLSDPTIDGYRFVYWELSRNAANTGHNGEYENSFEFYRRTNAKTTDVPDDATNEDIDISMYRIRSLLDGASKKEYDEATNQGSFIADYRVTLTAHFVPQPVEVKFQFYDSSNNGYVKYALEPDSSITSFGKGNRWTYYSGNVAIDLTETDASKYTYTKEDKSTAEITNIVTLIDSQNNKYFLMCGNNFVKTGEEFLATNSYYFIKEANIKADGLTLGVYVNNTAKTLSNGVFDPNASMNFDPTFTMANIFDYDDSVLLDGSDNKYVLDPNSVSLVGSSFKFSTWMVEIAAYYVKNKEKVTDVPTTAFYLPYQASNGGTFTNLETYARNLFGGVNSDGEHLPLDGTDGNGNAVEYVLVAHALYESKPYDITLASKETYGSSSMMDGYKDKIGSDVATEAENAKAGDLVNQTNIPAVYEYSELGTVFYLQSATVDVKLNNDISDGEDDSSKLYYIFNTVDVTNLGWMGKSGSNYTYGSVTLRFSFNGTSWQISLVDAKDSSGTAKSVSSLGLNLRWLDGHTKFSSSTQFVLNKEFYVSAYNDTQAASETLFNIFKITDVGDTWLKFEVRKVGICGAWFTSSKTDPVNTKDETHSTFIVNSNTATGNTVGFTVNATARSNYTPQDTFEFGSGSNALGSVLATNAQPVKALVNTDTDTTETCFWINNVRYVLGSNDAGYYKKGTGNTFNKQTSSLPSTTTGFKDNYIYFDGTYVYYSTKYINKTSSTTTSTTYKTNSANNEVNFNNTQIVAIRPEQYYAYNSTGAYSASLMNGTGGNPTYYEMTSYLSAISIGSTTYKLNLYRNNTISSVGANTAAGYSDFNFLHSDNNDKATYLDFVGGSLTTFNIKYFGVDYKVYCAYYFAVSSGREFVLYLTRNETNHEVMYFLYSDVYSEQTKADGGADNETIRFTFTEFDKDLTLSLTTNDDVFSNKDNPLVYRYSYLNSKFDTDYAFNSSNFTLSEGSDSSTAVSYFGKTTTNKYQKIDSAIVYDLNPTDYLVFELQPTDGYIIKNLKVEVGGQTLFNFAYNSSAVEKQPSEYYSYYINTTMATGGEARLPNFVYSGGSSKYFYSDAKNATNKAGVMYTQFNDKAARTWVETYDSVYMNPVWIMVSGMYDDVSISVETMSYVELYFEFDVGSLSSAVNANNLLTEHITILTDHNVDDSWDKVLPVNDSTIGDRIFVKSETGNSYRIVFEGQAKSSLFAGGIKFLASGNSYPYSNSYYFTEGKLYSDNTGHGVDGSTTKGMFFENLEYVKVGSNLTGDDFTGRTSLGESLYNNALISSTGAANNIIALTSKTMTYNDFATYIYIRDVRRVSSRSGDVTSTVRNYDLTTYTNIQDHTKDGADTGTEFSNKYFFYVKVKVNATTYGVNSYLYNSNLDTTQEKPYEANIFNNTVNSVDVYKPTDKDLEVGMIARILTSDGQAVSNNLLSLKIIEIQPFTYGENELLKIKFSSNMTGVTANQFLGKNYKLQFTKYYYSAQSTSSNLLQYYYDENTNWQWIYTSNGLECYQLDFVGKFVSTGDNYTKIGSWFNDTILTNIEYGFNSTFVNWQNVGAGNNFSNTQFAAGNASGSTYSGVGITYKYYEIPGYYLKYIEFDTIDFGRVYINVADITPKQKNNTLSGKLFGSGSVDTGYYYKLTYNKTEGLFTLNLFASTSSTHDCVDSIGFTSNSFDVNFYSYPYKYEIQLSENTGESTSKDYLEKFSSNGTDGRMTQSILYDNLTYIDTYLTMPGYTFIGWGSPSYYADGSMSSRYVDDDTMIACQHNVDCNHIWNTTSYWKSMKSEFASSNRTALLEWKDNYETYQSDFYVKSSLASNASMTAYFITDTGFTESAYGSVENYNFWSSYAREFVNTIGAYNPSATKAVFNLVGIWKANTYTLQFNVNDSTVDNGSTNAKLNIAGSGDAAKRILNETTASFDDEFKENYISFDISTTSNDNTTFYCYVRFDSMDWYITTTPASDINRLFSAKSNELTARNLFDVVVDRYGYSWLGWFSKDETDIKEGDNRDTIVDNRIFASSYYNVLKTTFVDSDSEASTLTLNYNLFNEFVANGSISESYSEFVYDGQHVVDTTKPSKYVYFYQYKTGVANAQVGELSGCYINTDYLNNFTSGNYNNTADVKKKYLTYFDTSLTYRCYSIDASDVVSITRSLAENAPQIKYLKLYAYWQINFYEFVIDWQDSEGVISQDTLNIYGSSPAGILQENGDIVKESFDGAYFDDYALSDRLNNFTPVRVGYDFLGWAYYYDLTKTNENQLISEHVVVDRQDTTMWLCRELTTYYGEFAANGFDNVPLYTTSGLLQSGYNSSLFSAQETFGVDSGENFVYIFAIWKAQTFTINVDLSIDYEELENLYEKDSRFAVALYKNAVNNINYDAYTGIRTSYYKQNANDYTELVANLNFVITFDKDFTEAYCEIVENGGVNAVTSTYKLTNLFATSTGYYFLGWLYNPELPSNMLVYNTLKSTFGTNGTAVNNVNGLGESKLSTDNPTFNLAMYENLYNTDYKDFDNPLYTGTEFFDPATNDNIKKLSTIDTHGASSNFGYINFNGEKCYIACDDAEVSGKHALYFKYNGLKYYVVIYNDTAENVLTNDHSFLYYEMNGIKYKVRYDIDGDPYIVTTNYGARNETSINLNLKIAAFETYSENNASMINFRQENSEGRIVGNLFEYDPPNQKYKFYYYPENSSVFVNGAEFVSETTRQFTLYAHWGNKNDLYFEIKNDSNSKVDGEYTYYSNPGLAGFYDVETYNEFERVDTNYNLNFAGHQHFVSDDASGSVAFGVDRFNFNYYDDLKLNILPFFNGRYLSEMKLTFYGIEETVLNTNEDKGQMHSVFKYTKYTLEFKFEWDAENHRIVIRTTNGIILRVNDGEATQYTFNGTFGKFDGSTETSDYYSLNHIKLANVTPLDKLSLLDKDLGGETFIAYILRMFEYSNGTESNERHETYGRTDVNKLSFDMEDIMTNIEISCKFSVQTYNVEFYSVLDKQTSDGVSDRGNLQLQSGTTNKYITNFASKSEFEANVADNNDVGASGTYLSRNAYTETKIATIPDDCSASTKLQDVTNFNIPYGYFLYGEFFTYSKYPNRPIDEASNVALLNNDLYGFEYIYSNGYYNYGTTTLKLKINDDDPTDSFVAQCAPILGPSYRFGNQAKGFRKEGLSFYTFGGWYQYDKTQTDKVVFVQYDRIAEATFISKNMVLYGYYYPINTPKSIDFYTWDDENKSYKVYTGNQGQYTLNANTETSGFKTDNNGYLYLNNQNSEFIDQNGVAKIQNYNIYGVNASGFSNDAFTSVWTNNIIYDDDGVTILDTYEIAQDFAQDNLTDQTILNSLIQTYWYYQESYKVLYFNDGSETHFVKYSQANQSFYFGDDPDQNKVKILSSDDNMETFTVILADGTEYEIHSTIIYRQNESLDESDYLTGNSDAEDAYNFKGAHLYVKETANLTDEITTNDIDRYYRIYEVSTEDYQAAVNGTYADECEGDLISNYNPRYWYEANGVKYFMMARNENNMKLSANTIYTATVNASGENTVVIDTTNNISVIKNYYVKYGVDYYPIKYKVYTDENGSEYISPMNDLTTNQVTVPLDVNTTELFYFDYNTRYLYERTENGQYVRVSFEHYIYCPINENYQVNTEVEKGSGNWTTGAITIKSLPSPNIGFWYDGDNYGFVGYIMVTNTMIEELKAPPSNEGDMGGEIYQRFIAYINAVYSKEAFDIVNFVDYDASTGTSALYQQFLAEYDTTGSGSLDLAHKGFVNTLTDHVTGRIAEYKIESHFIKNLLLAEEYEFEELASGEIIISGVKVNIPITFRDLMIDPRTNSQLTISLTVMPIKSFSVVSTNTSVDTNIHAIPIYSPYAMKFKNDALGGDDSQLVVDVEKMDVWHFELGSYSSYAYNKANGDLLNFVLLNKAQYTELVKNKENIAEKLSTIIKSMTAVERDAYITTENREVLATNTVSVDLSTCQEMNEYVVLAYYYKAGTTTTTGEYTSSSYVVRVSDNVVHLTFGTLGMSKEITTIDKL